jgi:uncharacterized damage-inducible protein DinB
MPLVPLFQRDLNRLCKEINAFPNDEQLWQTAPGVTNSAGNLALHLEGNLREFIGRQVGGVAYTRQRTAEFATKGLTRQDLIARIEATRDLVLVSLPAAKLDEIFPENVLGEPLTTRHFLLHLYGHLNYHLGQINYLRRLLAGE